MDELCRICERVRFSNIVLCGFGHWRHEHCVIGSIDWNVHYQRQSKAIKQVLKEFFDYHKGVNYE